MRNRTYIDPATGNTRYANEVKLADTQTSYVLPLAFGIIPEEIRTKVTDRLINTVKREKQVGRRHPMPSLFPHDRLHRNGMD